MNLSPLRFPGGKSKLTNLFKKILEENNVKNFFIEPFAGGAGLGVNLLFLNKIDNLIINDSDRSIYAFWYCVLNKNKAFCEKIEKTEINISNWKIQKSIQLNKKKVDLFSLGFSTFFLNRTNYSGIINAGPIGGKNQLGKYQINCRFNKKKLIKKIKLIHDLKSRIRIYNLDFAKIIIMFEKKKNAIFYFDPPYLENSKGLYDCNFKFEEHLNLLSMLKKMKARWVLSNSDSEKIQKMYKWSVQKIGKKLGFRIYKCKMEADLIFWHEKIDLKSDWDDSMFIFKKFHPILND